MTSRSRGPLNSPKSGSLIAAAVIVWLALGSALAANFPDLPPPPLEQNRIAPSPSPGSTVGSVAGGTAVPAAPAKPLPSVTISARVERAQVAQDQSVEFVVTLKWDESADAEAAPLDFEFPDPPSADGLTLFANSFRSETALENGKVKVERVYTYEFHADKTGSTEIKPVTVKYYYIGSQDKAELKTLSIPVTVTPERLTLAKLMAHPAFKAALAALALLCAAGLAWLWIRSRRKEKSVTEPTKTRHEIARERLRDADRLRMAGDYGAFLKALSAEMKRYCEDAMEIKARALSRGRLAEAVAEKLGEEWKARVEDMEKLADEVKFAGYEPRSAELDRAMETVKGMVAEGEKRQFRMEGNN